jgi:cysteine desulfurase
MSAIYLDYNATTPVAPEVLEAMLPYLRGEFGNPSSGYLLGRRSHEAVEKARTQVADLIDARPDEIIFTSGATEATNIAIRGSVAISSRRGVVTSNIEHPATDACCHLLERAGYSVRRVPAEHDGVVSVERMAEAISDQTALVTIIHAQNEIGTIQPVRDLSLLAHAQGALIHTDAAQSVGKVPISTKTLGVDLLTIAGHKLYAPKGIGALYMRAGLDLPPLVVGAGQENGRRPGTENVPFIVGLGEACALAQKSLEANQRVLSERTASLLQHLQTEVEGLVVVGDGKQRLPNTINVLFPGVSGRIVLQHCPDVLASTGSACHADSEDPSPIVSALGYEPAQALGAVRLSVGRATTQADVERAATALAKAWRTARGQHGATGGTS